MRGNHLSMLLEPHVESTVEVLKRCFARAREGGYLGANGPEQTAHAVSSETTPGGGRIAFDKFSVNGLFSMISSSLPLVMG